MIREQDVKPIPKHIYDIIEDKYIHSYLKYGSKTCFFSYLTKQNKDLVQITVACKSRGSKFAMKQVAVHGVHSDICLVKDMEFYNLCGYVVGWYEEKLSNTPKRYADGKWYEANYKYYKPYAPVVNLDYVYKFKQYQYCAIEQSGESDVIKYIQLYEEYPQLVEILTKFGLYRYAQSKMLLKKLTKDKAFRKWIISKKDELAMNYYYVSTLLLGYKLNKPLKQIQEYESDRKSFCHKDNYKRIKSLIQKEEYDKFLFYLQKQKTNLSSYTDYLDACQYLGIDMSLEMNKMPHDFKKWHDIRIDQYHTAKAIKDKQERENLYKRFEKVANKYLSLQRNLKDNYVCIIAKSPDELVNEGNILHHCVGRMNYDQKFIKEESLIFFVRAKNDITTPLVTVEYSIKNKKILQCYGDHDSKPSEDILLYVNNKWLPYANRKLKALA